MVNTSKEQTVADHSWRVFMIARRLGGSIPVDALTHDLDEIWTGDIPTHTKEMRMPEPGTEEWVVKVADIIETYTFIHQYHVDRHGKRVVCYMADYLRRAIEPAPLELRTLAHRVVSEILEGDITI